MKILFQTLGHKTTFWLLLGVWLINVVYSPLILPPADDDGFYLEGAMGVMHNLVPGKFIGDQLVLIHTTLPGYFVLQGGFWRAATAIGLPLTFTTYRLFQVLSIAALLAISVALLYELHKGRARSVFFANSNALLVLLAITPFGQLCWPVRPEVLGLMLIMLGLLFYLYWRGNRARNLLLWLCALSLGCSIIIHPNFSMRAALLLAMIMVFELKDGFPIRSLIFGIISCVPFALVVWWFYSGPPYAFQEFFHSLHTKKAGNTIGHLPMSHMVKFALGQANWGSKAVDLYYVLFWLPLLAVCLGVAFLFLRKGMAVIRNERLLLLLFALSIFEFVRMLTPEGDITYSYFTITAYFLVLFFTLLLFWNKELPYNHQHGVWLKARVVIQLCLAFLVLLHPLVHTVKFAFAQDKYYSGGALEKAIASNLSPDDFLFVCSGKLIPPLVELLNEKFLGSSKRGPHQLVAHSATEEWTRYIQDFVIKSIESTPARKTVWGQLKVKSDYDPENGTVSFLLSTYRRPYLQMKFVINEIIYEDKDNIFFRPDKIEFFKMGREEKAL